MSQMIAEENITEGLIKSSHSHDYYNNKLIQNKSIQGKETTINQ